MKLFTIILFFISTTLIVAQCPSNLEDPSPDGIGTAGLNIGFPNATCSGFTLGTSLTTGSIFINGIEFVSSGFCDGNGFETYNSSSTTPIVTTNGYFVDFDGGEVDCKYSPAGTLIPNVPTLSEWGLLILALLLMTMGTLYLINNKVVTAKEQ
ncbi:MAG: IPTL-CTERM sorting domain-containing protein [Chitinophagales bacterium]